MTRRELTDIVSDIAYASGAVGVLFNKAVAEKKY